jgi:phage terminase Nu1 subunit (DNA packaging protein)
MSMDRRAEAQAQSIGSWLVDSAVAAVPRSVRKEVTRVVTRLRDRLPPVVIERKIDALGEELTERMRRVEDKVDALARRKESSRAA